MSIKKDESGSRRVEVEIEVPGTPEQVWEAIASGPGISSWFVPTKIEAGDDGRPARVIAHFGPGMDSLSEIISWEPPHSFVAESHDLGPDAPPVATEWIVESRTGGRCMVRVVHSLFSSSDEWDSQLEGWESGWPDFFRILQIYLTHFGGLPSTGFQVMGASIKSAPEAWSAFAGRLGLSGAISGQACRAPEGAPVLAGIVEQPGMGEQVYLRLEEPAKGIAHLFAMPMGGKVIISARLYLFGDEATSVASREEPQWEDWMNRNFPFSADAS